MSDHGFLRAAPCQRGWLVQKACERSPVRNGNERCVSCRDTSRQAEKIDSTPKRSLHGARQPRHNATLQPPVCSALRFNMGVDGAQRIGAALTPRFRVASASGVNPALERRLVQRRRNWKVLLRMR
ncbi:unnamed protein product [Pleuronectes platessa]|uniref:Uncharacterized protein n=1 Tax=Pleuronectes platessa TaxID=8262 RepID=A0A9N7UGR9_PLEPL|nr:unnamed protein product [Pleuronectes platessa]